MASSTMICLKSDGATENAGVEKAIRAKLQGWKMQEWKKQEYSRGGKCRSKPYGTPTRDCVEKAKSYLVILVLILLTE